MLYTLSLPPYSVTSLAPPRVPPRSHLLHELRHSHSLFILATCSRPPLSTHTHTLHMKLWLLRCRIPHTINNISRLFCAIQSSHVTDNFVATLYPSTSTVFIRDILTCSYRMSTTFLCLSMVINLTSHSGPINLRPLRHRHIFFFF